MRYNDEVVPNNVMPSNNKAMPNNNRVIPNNTITIISVGMAPHSRQGLKCRLRLKLSPRLIRDIFSMYELVVNILRVTRCRSRNLFRENFLLGLLYSKKNIVIIENFYLFFNLKHKHLVICFSVKGIRIEAF